MGRFAPPPKFRRCIHPCFKCLRPTIFMKYLERVFDLRRHCTSIILSAHELSICVFNMVWVGCSDVFNRNSSQIFYLNLFHLIIMVYVMLQICFILFADDTNIFCSGKDSNSLKNYVKRTR